MRFVIGNNYFNLPYNYKNNKLLIGINMCNNKNNILRFRLIENLRLISFFIEQKIIMYD